MNTKLKIIASLLALFLLGAGTGWVARTNFAPAPTAAAAEPTTEWPKRTLEDYRARLDLTPAQMAALAPVFRETGEALRGLRSEMAERIAATLKSNSQQVARVLTPEQLEKFQQIIRENQERLHKTKIGN